jgi:hypothetical protein
VLEGEVVPEPGVEELIGEDGKCRGIRHAGRVVNVVYTALFSVYKAISGGASLFFMTEID